MSNKKKVWTQEEAELLLKIYKLYTNEELAEMFDCKISAINTKRNALGIGIRQLEAEANKDVPEGHKRCPECEEILPEDSFYLLCRREPERGRMKICKKCNNAARSKERADEKLKAKDNCTCDIIVKNTFLDVRNKNNKTHHCVKCGKQYSIK